MDRVYPHPFEIARGFMKKFRVGDTPKENGQTRVTRECPSGKGVGVAD
jgi:hypothetical protein